MLDTIKDRISTILGPEVAGSLSWAYWTFVGPLLSQPTLHWIFLLSSLGVACLYFQLFVASGGARGPRPMARYLFPRSVWLHPSAVLDYKFFVVTQFVLAYLYIGKFVIGLASVLFVAEGVNYLFRLVLGENPSPSAPSPLVVVAFTIVFTAAFDLARFFVHFIHHRVPILWEFHKVHHSAAVLTPMSSFRSHPVEQAMEFFFRLVFTAVVSGAFTYFYSGIREMTILGYGALMFVFHLTGHLRHSHVPVSYGPLSGIFVSPHMHQLHHSAAHEHFDKNFGFIFSVWDRMAGTLYIPQRNQHFELGLPKEAGRYETLRELYFGPFIASARLVRRAFASTSPSAAQTGGSGG